MKPIIHHLQLHRLRPQPFDRQSCAFWYSYYTHPWELARDLYYEVTDIVHRGVYGYATADIWSMDHTLTVILPRMLRALADDTCAYAGWCADHEEWTAFLRAHADNIEHWAHLLHDDDYLDRLRPADWLDRFREIEEREGLEAAFNAPSWIDDIPDEVVEASRTTWQAEVDAAKAKMHELIDHLEELWD